MKPLENEETKAKAVRVLEMINSIDDFIQNKHRGMPSLHECLLQKRYCKHDEEDLLLLQQQDQRLLLTTP
jgi:hypothetical protein